MFQRFMAWYCMRDRLGASCILFLIGAAIIVVQMSHADLTINSVWLYAGIAAVWLCTGIAANASRRIGHCDVLNLMRNCIDQEKQIRLDGRCYVILPADTDDDEDEETGYLDDRDQNFNEKD